ncbi:MAG: PrsW family glutamic-type intramembrane protease [Patescibacteria group bacterium]
MKYAVLLSFIGGIIPAVLWLQFWLREAKHREPRRLIVGTFVLGMLSVFVAGFLEKSVSIYVLEYTTLSFFIWAFIEELLKYLGANIVALKTRFVDEAIDPMIYMVTSALGFAAAENILFLFEPLANGEIGKSIMTLSFRFVGATLLHIIASGSIGIAIGFVFYKSKTVQKIATIVGIIIATILHTAFNSFIIIGEQHTIWVFCALWLGLIGVIFILEKIKNIKKIKI